MSVSIALAGAGIVPAHAAPHLTVQYFVDTASDFSGGGCSVAVDADCSLRSAIELANAGAFGNSYQILFNGDYNINLASPLPAITQSDVYISSTDGLNNRVVRVKGDGVSNVPHGNVFQILGDQVTIYRLTIYGASQYWANIYIAGTAKGIRISTNIIGAPDATGPCPSAASYGGIFVSSTGPVYVSAGEWRAQIDGNIIRCATTGNGIEVNGTNGVQIGLPSGNTVTENNLGVVLSNRAHDNEIDNSLVTKNMIGVLITNSYGNFVHNNNVGENTVGLQMDQGAESNIIGYSCNVSPSPGGANIICANIDTGLLISGTTTQDNLVCGNTIGRYGPADPSSHGNGQYGVQITFGAHNNFIGFFWLPERNQNIIGGNGIAGIALINGARDNRIDVNKIGALSENQPIPNNIGIYIAGSNTQSNQAFNNFIVRNTLDGVNIDGARNNTIQYESVIALNGRNGVLIQNGAQNNHVRNQSIYRNGRHGIALVDVGTTGNTVESDVIYLNNGDGINEANGADPNLWTHTTTESNYGMGIDRDGGNLSANQVTLPYPVILSVSTSGGDVLVSGIASTSSGAGASNTVEVYGIQLDASGFGEGSIYLGNAAVNMTSGTWSMTIASSLMAGYSCLTAYQTYQPDSGTPQASSEFGPSSCRELVPMVMSIHL